MPLLSSGGLICKTHILANPQKNGAFAYFSSCGGGKSVRGGFSVFEKIGATSSAISSISPISNFFTSSKSSSSLSSKGKNSKVLFSKLPPASRIFVENLSYATGEASLVKLFAKFGPIVEVKLAKHEETKKSKGYAFIQYTCQDDAILAIEQMGENIIDGRIVL